MALEKTKNLTKLESLSKYSFRYYLIQIGEKGFAYGSHALYLCLCSML